MLDVHFRFLSCLINASLGSERKASIYLKENQTYPQGTTQAGAHLLVTSGRLSSTEIELHELKLEFVARSLLVEAKEYRYLNISFNCPGGCRCNCLEISQAKLSPNREKGLAPNANDLV